MSCYANLRFMKILLHPIALTYVRVFLKTKILCIIITCQRPTSHTKTMADKGKPPAGDKGPNGNEEKKKKNPPPVAKTVKRKKKKGPANVVKIPTGNKILCL